MSSEHRLNQLEEQAYFQEQTITQLDQALTRQQSQMDALELRLTQAEKRLLALLPLLDEGGQNGPPPHYGHG